MKLPVTLALAAIALLAQSDAPTGSVSGRVLDADSGEAIADFPVENHVRTDAKGYYKLVGLKPGPFQISLRGERVWPELAVRAVTVEAGKELTGVDLRIRLDGDISGRVVDQNKEPVGGMPVRAIGREYYAGGLHYFADTGSATTNDRGEYVLRNVRAGRALLLLVEKHKLYEGPISEAPADPKMRKPAYRATYYPNADSVEAATFVTLRSGERREGMDIQVLRSAGYCINATLMVESAPASLDFKVTDELTSSANMIPGSASSGPTGVSSGPDGKIRICDLYPGQFRIAALRRAGTLPAVFGATGVTIGREDVQNVRVIAGEPIVVPGEVAWEGIPRDGADKAQFSLQTPTVTNDSMPSSRPRYPIPGPFSFSALRAVEHLLQPGIGPPNAFPNAYVKDITYGVSSVLHQTFRASSEGTLRVTVANDGGFVKASAPAGTQILILPGTAATEAALADAMVSGQADLTGNFTSRSLAPGKYYVLATNDLIDHTPECIANIRRARNRGQDVDVGPNAIVTVILREAISLPSAGGR